MTYIETILLFVSSFSQSSRKPHDYVKKYSLPVEVIFLDDAESRLKAKNGKFFSITHVPTAVSIYSDKNFRVWAGLKQSMLFFESVKESLEESRSDHRSDHRSESQIPHLERYSESSKKKKKRSKKSSVVEPVEIEFVDEPFEPSHAMNPNIESKLSTNQPKPSKMQDIKAMAKEMEQQMRMTYGYREEDLPRT